MEPRGVVTVSGCADFLIIITSLIIGSILTRINEGRNLFFLPITECEVYLQSSLGMGQSWSSHQKLSLDNYKQKSAKFSYSNSFNIPVVINMICSVILVTRSAIRSRLWEHHIKYVQRMIIFCSFAIILISL